MGKKNRRRLVEIDILTGIAITLVVLGHLANPNTIQPLIGNNTYAILKENIYLFHMPLFMFLSGSVFYYTLEDINSISQYFKYIKKKALRLLPGLFLFGSIMILAKMILLSKGNIENLTLYDLFVNYYKLLLEPMNSFSRSLWYIYVLMEYYIVFPILLLVFKQYKYLLIIIGLLMYVFFTQGEFLAFKEFATYFIYFSIGILFMSNYDLCISCFKKYCLPLNIIFLLSFSLPHIIDHKYSMLIVGLLSIAAFYSVVLCYFNNPNNIFSKIGKYTFSIYLMNTLVIGFTETVLLRYVRLNNENFTYIFPFIFILGLSIPILLRKYFFSKIYILDKITR